MLNGSHNKGGGISRKKSRERRGVTVKPGGDCELARDRKGGANRPDFVVLQELMAH